MPTSPPRKRGDARPVPLQPHLYRQIKEQVYAEIPTHSAYRSGLVVQRYKQKGGKYSGDRERGSLRRWFKEEWRNQRGEEGYREKGDVYRPTRRVDRNTPKTFRELGASKIRSAMKEKAIKGRVQSFDNYE